MLSVDQSKQWIDGGQWVDWSLFRIIGVLLGVLGGAAAPRNCWRSRKFLGCRKFLGVGQKLS